MTENRPAAIHSPKSYAHAVGIALDTSAFQRAVRRLAQATARMHDGFTVGAATLTRAVARREALLRERHNDPVRVAGVQGRYYVRAAWLSHEDHLVALLTDVLNGDAEGTRYLDPENRTLVVSTILQAWATSYDGDGPEVLAWHRDFGSIRVLVGRAAA